MAQPVQVQGFKELVAILRANGRALEVDETEQALVVATPDAELGGKLIVRWEASLPFVHIIQPMLADVPAERATDVSLTICRLNNASKFPGLGYDEAAAVVYYRITVVILADGVRSDLMAGMIRGAPANAKELLAAMRAVVAGATPEQAVALAGG